MKQQNTVGKIALPKGLKDSDIARRRMPMSYYDNENKHKLELAKLKLEIAKHKAWRKKNKLMSVQGAYTSDTLTMHYTERFGWVIATLHISNGKAGREARSYGINLQGQIVTCGNGPHILRTIHVYLYEDRQKALQPYIDLYNKGMIDANNIRDVRSTRIAQTRARRSRLSGEFGSNSFGGCYY